jgi:hypothetical protein
MSNLSVTFKQTFVQFKINSDARSAIAIMIEFGKPDTGDGKTLPSTIRKFLRPKTLLK